MSALALKWYFRIAQKKNRKMAPKIHFLCIFSRLVVINSVCFTFCLFFSRLVVIYSVGFTGCLCVVRLVVISKFEAACLSSWVTRAKTADFRQKF